MLRWRLAIGALLIAALAGICWLDAHAQRGGAYLAALAAVAALLAAGEMLRLGRRRGIQASASSAYVAAVMPVAFSAMPVFFPQLQFNLALGNLGWLALGVTLALMDAFISEMRRYQAPGHAAAGVAHLAVMVLYVGGLVGMLVQLRIVMPPTMVAGWSGLFPLLSMIATVKLSDTCQYFVGRSAGRRKLAPLISPGKTWEGAVGGILVATLAAAGGLTWIARGGFDAPYFAAACVYALTVAIAGLFGDLGESLLKRDAGVKDSSEWLPGFGGVLDLLDSILFAGPVAYLWWVSGALEY